MLMAAGRRVVGVDAQGRAVPAGCRLPAWNPAPHSRLLPERASVADSPSKVTRSIEAREGPCSSADPLTEACGSAIGRERLLLAWETVIRNQLVRTLRGFGVVA